jgi:hypothetical protein
MRSFDARGTEAWPQKSAMDSFEKAILGQASKKTFLRHNLLQPLAPQTSLVRSNSCGALATSKPLSATSPFGQPYGYPGLAPPPRVQETLANPGHCSRPTTGSRPSTSSRPRTAGGGPLPIGSVTFPSKLHLRVPGEAASTPNQWAVLSDNFVLPLETQSSVRQVSDACSAARLEVFEGVSLSLWTATTQEETTSHVLEPLAARREDSTLAVEPVELTIERPSESSPRGHIKYGECFRLRATDGMLYLGHGSDGGGLRWERVHRRELASGRRGLRFVAHGGELGKPLHFGRPLTLRRVASPAPQSDNETESDSEFSAHGSDSETEILLRGVGLRPGPGSARTKRSQQRDRTNAIESSPSAATGVSRSMLLSRLADVEGGVSATMLPAEFALDNCSREHVQTLFTQDLGH